LASWDFPLGTSKIAPHSFSLLAEREVLLLEFLDGHAYSVSGNRDRGSFGRSRPWQAPVRPHAGTVEALRRRNPRREIDAEGEPVVYFELGSDHLVLGRPDRRTDA
jgi:hypothetical protein